MGRLLRGFSWFWLVLNVIALVIVIFTTLGLGLAGAVGEGENIITMFAGMAEGKVEGMTPEAIRALVAWDFSSYSDHYWISVCYFAVALVVFAVTMALILRIAAAWKRGDVFGDKPIQCFRLLSWILEHARLLREEQQWTV